MQVHIQKRVSRCAPLVKKEHGKGQRGDGARDRKEDPGERQGQGHRSGRAAAAETGRAHDRRRGCTLQWGRSRAVT